MTLRWRFATILALFSVVIIAIAGLVVYDTTSSRLSGSVDSSLEQAVGILVTQLPPPVAPARPSGGGGPPAQRRPHATPPPPDLLNLVVEQRLGRDGAVVDDSSSISLPVTAGDKALATSGEGRLLETVIADGDPYRVISVALPNGGVIQLGRDVRENEQLLQSLRWRLLLTGAAVGVVAALVGSLIAQRTTRPLKRLSVAAEDIARSNDLSIPIATEGRDEIGRLGRSFSTMLGALARSRAQQKRLIEDAAHELRTPLTSLRSNIDTMRRHPDLNQEQRAPILNDLSGELAELTSLVGELIELGTDQYADGPAITVRLDQMAEAAAQRTRVRSGRTVEVDAVPWSVEAPQGSFERVISNLLDNAVKFSPEGAPIHVLVEPGRLEVSDRGTGIAEEDLLHIFDRFYRSGTARALPGSGLGLAIVKDTVERCGGTVFARNDPEGGAALGFTIPEP